MDEKIYKSMGRIGGANIAMGIVCIVVGVTVGVLFFRKRKKRTGQCPFLSFWSYIEGVK